MIGSAGRRTAIRGFIIHVITHIAAGSRAAGIHVIHIHAILVHKEILPRSTASLKGRGIAV